MLFSMVKDYTTGSYSENIPLKTILGAVFTLGYIISPIDLIPDVIPVIGFTDDLAVLTTFLWMARSDVNEYRKWKTEESDDNEQ